MQALTGFSDRRRRPTRRRRNQDRRPGPRTDRRTRNARQRRKRIHRAHLPDLPRPTARTTTRHRAPDRIPMQLRGQRAVRNCDISAPTRHRLSQPQRLAGPEPDPQHLTHTPTASHEPGAQPEARMSGTTLLARDSRPNHGGRRARGMDSSWPAGHVAAPSSETMRTWRRALNLPNGCH
jgi:hypothetical protein